MWQAGIIKLKSATLIASRISLNIGYDFNIILCDMFFINNAADITSYVEGKTP